LRFEWDPLKAAANAVKHGVSFDEATTVFDDPDAIDGLDFKHSALEVRTYRVGRSIGGRVLTITYTRRRHDNGEEAIRIITARPASRQERRLSATARL
jgi:hypothetical protein